MLQKNVFIKQANAQVRPEEAEPGREGAAEGGLREDVLRLPDHPPKEARDA